MYETLRALPGIPNSDAELLSQVASLTRLSCGDSPNIPEGVSSIPNLQVVSEFAKAIAEAALKTHAGANSREEVLNRLKLLVRIVRLKIAVIKRQKRVAQCDLTKLSTELEAVINDAGTSPETGNPHAQSREQSLPQVPQAPAGPTKKPRWVDEDDNAIVAMITPFDNADLNAGYLNKLSSIDLAPGEHFHEEPELETNFTKFLEDLRAQFTIGFKMDDLHISATSKGIVAFFPDRPKPNEHDVKSLASTLYVGVTRDANSGKIEGRRYFLKEAQQISVVTTNKQTQPCNAAFATISNLCREHNLRLDSNVPKVTNASNDKRHITRYFKIQRRDLKLPGFFSYLYVSLNEPGKPLYNCFSFEKDGNTGRGRGYAGRGRGRGDAGRGRIS